MYQVCMGMPSPDLSSLLEKAKILRKKPNFLYKYINRTAPRC